MGTCWGSPSYDPNPSSTFRNPSTPGTSNNYTSNNIEFSATTSSSAGKSQFSEAATEKSEETYPNGQILETPNLKVFNFVELKSATKNFKSDALLGEGGFGKVYKGWMDEKTLAPSKMGSGMVVAIKKLNSESTQGFQEWQSEVNFLGRLSHPNLVKLLGYCWEDKELLLVYEFLPKGSFENHLFRRNPAIEPLSWDIRLKIVIGAARGLAFLHTSEKVIYRDFKASNILLDGIMGQDGIVIKEFRVSSNYERFHVKETYLQIHRPIHIAYQGQWAASSAPQELVLFGGNYNAKISDFGLAKLGPAGGDSHVTTRVMGTYGYAAPEYIATGHLYVKSDVYGFGVVLLEMITGSRAFDCNRPIEQRNLVDWLKGSLHQKRKLKTIMDAKIEGQYSSKAAFRAAQLTVKCLESDPKHRPSMEEVVEMLEHIASMEKPKPSMFSSSNSSTRRHGQ